MQNTYVAIMAGGIGSRFWPQSRISYPKQFLDILGTGESLLTTTFKRFSKIVGKDNIFIVTNERYADLCKEHLPDIKEEMILKEPSRRNTAPCIAYVTYKLAQQNPYAKLIVAPSDHLITDTDAFKDRITEGIEFVSGSNTLLTLGIRPTRPDTNYGYIQFHEEADQDNIHRVRTFTEKPNLEIAQSFLESGDFLWNSGIFLWSVQAIIEAFQQHLPEIAELFEEGKSAYNTPKEEAFLQDAYANCRNISIDYGIMEKAQNVYVIPSSFGWSDLGTWTSLWDNADKDEKGNVIHGSNIMAYGNENTLIKTSGEERLVIVQGLKDCCVIDTKDALLICQLNQEHVLRKINDDIKEQKDKKYL